MSGAPVSARDGGRHRDSRHAGARGVVAKHARPTGRSALCRPHRFTRRERKETPRERAGPFGQYPGPARHDSIGVAVPSTPEEQRLAALAASTYIRSGRARTKVPRATCEGTGLQGGWDPSATRLLSASHAHGHTSTLESVLCCFRPLSAIRITPSEWRPQAPDLSRDSARARSAACVRLRRS